MSELLKELAALRKEIKYLKRELDSAILKLEKERAAPSDDPSPPLATNDSTQEEQ